MDNQLQVIVKDSGLEKNKADFILTQFQDYFKIAADWEEKAKKIVVTDASQTTEMEMARMGRLFLRDKRIAVEKARKSLKEQCIREGKAIEGIANVLKALIVPIEEYLDKQEHFVDIKKKEEEERIRIEDEKKAEEERLRQEKIQILHNEREKQLLPYLQWWEEELKTANLGEMSDKEFNNILLSLQKEKADFNIEQNKIRVENEKLRKQKEAAEKKRKEQEEKMKKEREKAEAEKRAIEEKARKEREEVERKAKEEKEKQEAALAAQKAQTEKERKEAEERENKLQEELANKKEIECPFCHKKFTI
jgi:hypothetical protein